MPIAAGIVKEMTYTVEEKDLARVSGGETLPPVLSTPRMISLLEQTAHRAVLPELPDNQTTVGSLVNVRHLAPTPPGMQVRTRVELLEVDRRRLRFKVEAWDAVEKIAEGEHERFIIDKAKFKSRLAEKRNPSK